MLGLAAARAARQLRREARGERELDPEGERNAGLASGGGVGVEQAEVVDEQVVGGPVGLARVEQPQQGVAAAPGGLQRRPVVAQARVALERRSPGHREQVAAALVQHHLEPEEGLEAPAESRARPARALGDRADPPRVAE